MRKKLTAYEINKRWAKSPDGVTAYHTARAEAQKKANELQRDIGLEVNGLFKCYHTFILPNPENRFGHELWCEVVHPEIVK
jgi:hypothetical protein